MTASSTDRLRQAVLTLWRSPRDPSIAARSEFLILHLRCRRTGPKRMVFNRIFPGFELGSAQASSLGTMQPVPF